MKQDFSQTTSQSPARVRRELQPADVIAIRDAREQLPFDLSPLRVQLGSLATGDYSVVGLEHVIAIERKSLPDLVACCGVERERFEREIQRLLAYPCRAVLVEATWAQILAGDWRSKITAASVTGSILGWIIRGIPFLFLSDHEEAGKACARLLFHAARHRWRESLPLVESVLASRNDGGAN